MTGRRRGVRKTASMIPKTASVRARTRSSGRRNKPKQSVEPQNIAPPKNVGVHEPDQEKDEHPPAEKRKTHSCSVRTFRLQGEADSEKKREDSERFHIDERGQDEIDSAIPGRRA